tara:strand:- start:60 stop:365 length:306 start_codon:yes stop_codon:yes gene_type:complete
MAITQKWEVTNLTRDVRDGYVYAVEFKLTANEGAEVIGTTTGEVGFMDKPTTLPSEFIAYSDLDESTTLKWVKDNLGAKKVEEIEKAVECLNKLAHGVPWE